MIEIAHQTLPKKLRKQKGKNESASIGIIDRPA